VMVLMNLESQRVGELRSPNTPRPSPRCVRSQARAGGFTPPRTPSPIIYNSWVVVMPTSKLYHLSLILFLSP